MAMAAPTCNDVIKACDKALEDKQVEIKAKDKLIDTLDKVSKDQAVKIAQDDKEKRQIYRNPAFLITAGVGFGLAGMPVAAIGLGLGVLASLIF